MSQLATLQLYNKDEVLKMCASKSASEKEMQEDIYDQIMKKLREFELDKEEEKKITEILEYEYKYKNAITIPTKTSVTEIKTWHQIAARAKKEPTPNCRGAKKEPTPNCRFLFIRNVISYPSFCY